MHCCMYVSEPHLSWNSANLHEKPNPASYSDSKTITSHAERLYPRQWFKACCASVHTNNEKNHPVYMYVCVCSMQYHYPTCICSYRMETYAEWCVLCSFALYLQYKHYSSSFTWNSKSMSCMCMCVSTIAMKYDNPTCSHSYKMPSLGVMPKHYEANQSWLDQKRVHLDCMFCSSQL
jgi:hypothetical protein